MDVCCAGVMCAGRALPVVVCHVSSYVCLCYYGQCEVFVAATQCYGCVCAYCDASRDICPMQHCTAQLDVSNPLTQMAQRHHEILSQKLLFYS